MQYISNDFFQLAGKLFPINRSITGNGVRQTLNIIREHLPNLEILEIPSGTKVFDWTVPKEWNVKEAYLLDPNGKKIADFKENNLSLLGYSSPVNDTYTLRELNEHLFSLPDRPDAIPYATSYYAKNWGFCLPHNVRTKLKDGLYEAQIDTTHTNGSLSIGELIIPGESDEEIFLSTYTCHPSMANNETSGLVVATFLANWLSTGIKRRFTYRIVFAPETIGPLAYMAKGDMLNHLKNKVRSAFNITCVGDDNTYSFLPSKSGNTLTDKVARHVLEHHTPGYKEYSFATDRGSDEMQYVSSNVDLPMVSIMRSKYGEYPEYHTSDDNLNFISGEGLMGAYSQIKACIEVIEKNRILKTSVVGEPQFSKYGLRSTLGAISPDKDNIMIYANLLGYADGQHDLIDIANLMNVPVEKLFYPVEQLKNNNLITTE